MRINNKQIRMEGYISNEYMTFRTKGNYFDMFITPNNHMLCSHTFQFNTRGDKLSKITSSGICD